MKNWIIKITIVLCLTGGLAIFKFSCWDKINLNFGPTKEKRSAITEDSLQSPSTVGNKSPIFMGNLTINNFYHNGSNQVSLRGENTATGNTVVVNIVSPDVATYGKKEVADYLRSIADTLEKQQPK